MRSDPASLDACLRCLDAFDDLQHVREVPVLETWEMPCPVNCVKVVRRFLHDI